MGRGNSTTYASSNEETNGSVIPASSPTSVFINALSVPSAPIDKLTSPPRTPSSPKTQRRARLKRQLQRGLRARRFPSLTFVAFVVFVVVVASVDSFPNFKTELKKWIVVKEDEKPGTNVYSLEGVDNDVNKELNLELDGGTAKSILKVVRVGFNSFQLQLSSPLDRETVPEYQVRLKLYVIDNPTSNIGGEFPLFVEDVNDNQPVFQGLPYSVNVPEDENSSAALLRVTATDADSGRNKVLTYSFFNLTNVESSLFSIDFDSGQISLQGKLDFQERNFYSLSVRATDGGKTPLHADTKVFVNVVDRPDTPPRFLSIPYSRTVEESSSLTDIVVVIAVDGDTGVDEPIRYSIEDYDGSNDADFFEIDAKSGKITAPSGLDREKRLSTGGVFRFVVVAREVYSGASSRTEVVVAVADVDDNSPAFDANVYVGSIGENASPGSPVDVTPPIVARDPDAGVNGRFRVYCVDDYDAFEVRPNSSQINEIRPSLRVKNSSAIDFESTREIRVALVAEEDVPTTTTTTTTRSTAIVVVAVIDANDNFPQFDAADYEAVVAENATAGTEVIRIRATDADSGLFGRVGFRPLKGSYSDLFDISVDGVVRVSNSADLDFESINEFYFTVEAQDNNADGTGNSNSTSLVIRVSDVNDHRPRFDRLVYEATIDESDASDAGESPPRFATPLFVKATDADERSTSRSHITYSIVGGNINSSFGVDALTGEVVAVGVVDYEGFEDGAERVFNLTVEARDDHGLASTAQVHITVRDVNDNAPSFERATYSARVDEDASSGHRVVVVKATDADSLPFNGMVGYRLTAEANAAKILDKFEVDFESGRVTVARGADLDLNGGSRLYEVVVTAFDEGVPRRSADCLVRVLVDDVNNKAPVFVGAPFQAEVSEAAPSGAPVINATATDADDDADLIYEILTDEITGHSASGLPISDASTLALRSSPNFVVDSSTGAVVVAEPLDRELAEVVVVPIRVRDRNATGGTKQEATTLLRVRVTDVNDNAPDFGAAVFIRQIPENNPATVLAFPATDVDESADITYSLIPESDWAWIDPLTGMVNITAGLDRETMTQLNLTLVATDVSPPNTLISNAKLLVQITDVNDNHPVITNEKLEFNVSEDAIKGTLVTRLTATDEDDGRNAQVIFLKDSLFPPREDFDVFVLDAATGDLVVNRELDRERAPRYVLMVKAIDQGSPPQESSRQVIINVDDVNDHAPVFRPMQLPVRASESDAVGKTLATLLADDDDEGPNAAVTYGVVGDNNGTRLFQIGATTGVLSPSTSLAAEFGVYVVTIEASDAGSPKRLSTTLDVVVDVEDTNDFSPDFMTGSNNTVFEIWESDIPNRFVGRVLALDGDHGDFGRVTYSIQASAADDDWRRFAVDAKNGSIFTTEAIDREAWIGGRLVVKDKYYITIKATDGGTPPRESAITVTVHVRDVNDQMPEFEVADRMVQLFVDENLLTDSVIGTIPRAVDRDSAAANNNRICYYILQGNCEGVFFLEKETGVLSQTRSLDREARDSYSLIIGASDNCDLYPIDDSCIRKSKSERAAKRETVLFEEKSKLRVDVVVRDVNDNKPQFVQKTFRGGVSAGTKVDTRVMALQVTDADIGDNSAVVRATFVIVGGIFADVTPKTEFDKAPFVVDRESGEIFVKEYFSSSTKGKFSFTVRVTDSGNLSDEAVVEIFLLRRDQQVKFVLRATPKEVIDNEWDLKFASFLSNVTGAKVNVDDVQVHRGDDGKADETLTDLVAHFVDPSTEEIWEAKRVIELADDRAALLQEFFKELDIIRIERNADASSLQTTTAQPWSTDSLPFILLILMVPLLCIALLITSIAFYKARKRYQTKLRAASAHAYVSSFEHAHPSPGASPVDEADARGQSFSKLDLPGTNQYAYEGANPIYMERSRLPVSQITGSTLSTNPSMGGLQMEYDNLGFQQDFDSGIGLGGGVTGTVGADQTNGRHDEDDQRSRVSSNSLDENCVEHLFQAGKPMNTLGTFDEQEISVRMYNDENDVENLKGQTYINFPAPDLFLKAALEEHEKEAGRSSQASSLAQPRDSTTPCSFGSHVTLSSSGSALTPPPPQLSVAHTPPRMITPPPPPPPLPPVTNDLNRKESGAEKKSSEFKLANVFATPHRYHHPQHHSVLQQPPPPTEDYL